MACSGSRLARSQPRFTNPEARTRTRECVVEIYSVSGQLGMERVKQIIASFQTREGRMKGSRFKPRPSDILIVTPMKTGTTWVQQIAHQLRTGGDMDFKEITEVVPYIESAHDMHLDLEAESKVSLGLFRR